MDELRPTIDVVSPDFSGEQAAHVREATRLTMQAIQAAGLEIPVPLAAAHRMLCDELRRAGWLVRVGTGTRYRPDRRLGSERAS